MLANKGLGLSALHASSHGFNFTELSWSDLTSLWHLKNHMQHIQI